ncbi:transglycosylase domain-containing protein [bacterium]|nr:transglycosylase domain-containing protein [bacterium]
MKIVKLVFLVLFFTLTGLGSGIFVAGYLHYSSQLPELDTALNYQPSLITHVFDRNGELLAEFADEYRIPVPLSDVARVMQDAIIAIEDKNYYSHRGLDLEGILRAAWINYQAGDVVQGGSTITQQLAKSLFLTHERKLSRKIREAILAFRLEEELTKNRILELYLNQVYFGSGAYGIESASRRYFNKSAADLEINEAAMLAGLPKAPSTFSPLINPELAKNRRNLVLQRMFDSGIITKEQADQCMKMDLRLNPKSRFTVQAPYFVEVLRRSLEEEYGHEVLYRNGWDIHTTLDINYQRVAEKAVTSGLLTIEKRRRQWRGPVKGTPDKKPPKIGFPALAVITNVNKKSLSLNCAGMDVVLQFKDIWIKNRDLLQLTPGDKVYYVVMEYEEPDRRAIKSGKIVQAPVPDAALLSMNVQTGEVLAWVGGYSFWRSQFDRVSQAIRQPGSAFKPFIYAQALDTYFTAADVLYDTPIVVEKTWKTKSEIIAEKNRKKAIAAGDLDPDEIDILEDIEFWKPHNYSEEFFGATTLRQGLAKSRNIMSIHLLRKLGSPSVIRLARRLGIKSPLTNSLALALGSSGVTLLELTQAYGAIANLGYRTEPLMIRQIVDRDGRIVKEYYPALRPTLSPETAYLTPNLLRAVITQGTGFSANELGYPLAGKTGTTNNYYDAWFMGYSPHIITGVWVGVDKVEEIFKRATGASAALPIWKEYMKYVLADFEPEPFPVPDNIVFARVCRKSGLLATPNCEKTILEAFRIGTTPLEYCSGTCDGSGNSPVKSSLTDLTWDDEPTPLPEPTPEIEQNPEDPDSEEDQRVVSEE